MDSRAVVLVKKEVRDICRDWRLSLPALLFSLLIPSIVVVGVKLVSVFGPAQDPRLTLEAFYPISFLIVCFFPNALTVVIALENFVGEKERATLENLLLTPITDQEFYLGKFISSILPPLALGFLSASIYLIQSIVFLRHTINLNLGLLILLLIFVKCIILVSGATVISSQSKTVRAANFTATVIVLPVTLLLGVESYFLMYNKIPLLWFLLLGLIIYAIIFTRIGLKIFRRENMLTYDERIANLNDFLHLLKEKFLQAVSVDKERLTFKRLIIKDIPLLLGQNKRNIMIMSVFLLGGFFLGFFYSLPLAPHFPESAINLKTGAIKLFPKFTPLGIAFHNLRALLIVLIISFFTFGASAILFVLIPGAMIGFLIGINPDHSIGFILGHLKHLFPHGVLELPAAVISAAFVFKLGTIIMLEDNPQNLLGNILQALVNFLKILIIVVPLFIIAAYLEAGKI